MDDDTTRQAWLDQLTLLDERHVNALEHLWVYQDHLKCAYNAKIHLHEFQVGDLVLKETNALPHLHDKFATNWLGPYIITQKVGNSTYRLADLEGTENPEPLNVLHLKAFYC